MELSRSGGWRGRGWGRAGYIGSGSGRSGRVVSVRVDRVGDGRRSPGARGDAAAAGSPLAAAAIAGMYGNTGKQYGHLMGLSGFLNCKELTCFTTYQICENLPILMVCIKASLLLYCERNSRLNLAKVARGCAKTVLRSRVLPNSTITYGKPLEKSPALRAGIFGRHSTS